MTAQEIQCILTSHLNWRQGKGTGRRLDAVNFKDINLQNANLSNVDLDHASLEGVDFESANLESANLDSADLDAVHFLSVNLTNASLKNSCLKFAYCVNANLTNANLQYANLTGAVFKGANLQGVDLQHAKFIDTDFSGAFFGTGENAVKFNHGTFITRQPLTITNHQWKITITDDVMCIGCQSHLIEDWASFNDFEIHCMHQNALSWWIKNRDDILKLALDHQALCKQRL